VKIPDRRDPKADIFKLVHNWLRDERKGKWLLILDNADDVSWLFKAETTDEAAPASWLHDRPTKPLPDHLPQSQNGSILITTRTRSVAPKLVEEGDVIAVEPMDKAHALALLEKKLGEGLTKQTDRADIAELAEALESMPLAMVQATAYIRQRAPRCSVRQYIEEFNKNDKRKVGLLNNEAGHLRRDQEAKNSIIVTWQISFDYINETRPSAANLLSLMSFFDRQGIPESLLKSRNEGRNVDGNGDGGNYKDDSNEDDDGDGESTVSDSSVNDKFESNIDILRSYSFITTSTDGTTFEMHGLVQLATRNWLEANSQLERWKVQYIKNLYMEFPTGEHANWVKC
jgi:hypothetical protein